MRAAERDWTPDRARQALGRLPRRISHIVRPWAETMPDHPALVEGDTFWSYGELGRHVAETGARLIELGVRPGDRVMIVSENSLALAALVLAAAEIDAWSVIVNAAPVGAARSTRSATIAAPAGFLPTAPPPRRRPMRNGTAPPASTSPASARPPWRSVRSVPPPCRSRSTTMPPNRSRPCSTPRALRDTRRASC